MSHWVCKNCGNDKNFIAKGQINTEIRMNGKGNFTGYIDDVNDFDKPIVTEPIKCMECGSTDIEDVTKGETIEYERILKATKEWVREFNSISTSIFNHIFNLSNSFDFLHEITRNIFAKNEEVFYNSIDELVVVESILGNGKKAIVSDREGRKYEVDVYELEDPYEKSVLPSWGTMWSFNNSLDEDWARENPDKVKECGFRLYEYTKSGELYLGIDGGGYDFYSHHWVPLYKARGLEWHKNN